MKRHLADGAYGFEAEQGHRSSLPHDIELRYITRHCLHFCGSFAPSLLHVDQTVHQPQDPVEAPALVVADAYGGSRNRRMCVPSARHWALAFYDTQREGWLAVYIPAAYEPSLGVLAPPTLETSSL